MEETKNCEQMAAASYVNKAVILREYCPAGFPTPSHFDVQDLPVPELKDGQFLVKTKFFSLDPYMRGRMTGRTTYVASNPVGEPMAGGSVGEVVESKNAAFAVGDVVFTGTGWQTYTIHETAHKVAMPAGVSVSAALGVLGMPGMTAYFGFLDICEPKEGETVFVSGGAGAVGALVGQIAKLKGCYVVGCAGDDEKVAFMLKESGYDAAFNYKSIGEADYKAKVAELCPKGIDCYFDNTGGPISDAVIANMNTYGRVSVCGQIHYYNAAETPVGPVLATSILTKQLKVQGFIVTQKYAARFLEGIAAMAQWLAEGKLVAREHIVDGVENAPAAFLSMLQGGNQGKTLIRVA